MVELLLHPIEFLAQFVAILDDVFKFILVDLEKLAGLELDDALLELPVLLLKLPDDFLEVLVAGRVDFARGLGVVGRLGIGEEGLLGADLVQSVLDVLGPGGLALGPSEFLHYLVSALLRHISTQFNYYPSQFEIELTDRKSFTRIYTHILPTLTILQSVMSCILGCLAYCFCDVLCCECNQYIFPAPRFEEYEKRTEKEGIWEFKSFQSQGRNVPYLKLYSAQSEQSKRCFLYFHGNGEDIGYLGYFLQHLFDKMRITFYAIEYPTYGEYNPEVRALISNKIKQDALNFYEFVRGEKKRSQEDIYVIGRSIGSGPAVYLAANKPVTILILISPFDSIKKVSKEIFGCMGTIVKEHFNNEEQIVKVKGKILLIHGEKDQVIGVSHARNLIKVYQQNNQYKSKAVKVYPPEMTHNKFLVGEDIIAHVDSFLRTYVSS